MMRHPLVDPGTLERWLTLSRSPAIDRAIRALHTEIAERVAGARPVCTASARCCHFERVGHDLFVTGLEAAWTLDRIPSDRAICVVDVEASRSRGDCPFLVGVGPVGACGVHPARPAGCRVYFCDPTRERFVQDLAEHAAVRVRELHGEFDVPYLYAEWRGLLMAFARAGVAAAPGSPAAFAPADPFVSLTRGGSA
ncbi:MAG: hypothetical protein AAGF47_04495 [Planctomycetota bacterium]